MRIALYIEDGVEQIVLTPESDTEKSILGKLTSGQREMKIYRGAFYACQGGWTRWKQEYPNYSPMISRGESHDDSAIIVLSAPKAAEEPAS